MRQILRILQTAHRWITLDSSYWLTNNWTKLFHHIGSYVLYSILVLQSKIIAAVAALYMAGKINILGAQVWNELATRTKLRHCPAILSIPQTCLVCFLPGGFLAATWTIHSYVKAGKIHSYRELNVCSLVCFVCKKPLSNGVFWDLVALYTAVFNCKVPSFALCLTLTFLRTPDN